MSRVGESDPTVFAGIGSLDLLRGTEMAFFCRDHATGFAPVNSRLRFRCYFSYPPFVLFLRYELHEPFDCRYAGCGIFSFSLSTLLGTAQMTIPPSGELIQIRIYIKNFKLYHSLPGLSFLPASLGSIFCGPPQSGT